MTDDRSRRALKPIDVEPGERAVLEGIARHGNAYESRRARLLLLSADGLGVDEIVQQLGLSRKRVRYWIRGFTQVRLNIFSARTRARFDTTPAGETTRDEQPAPALERENGDVVAEVTLAGARARPGVDRPRQRLRLNKSPGVMPDDPMAEAGRKVLFHHFERMLQHEPGTRQGEDIEALHDMRVATRRMRAAFQVFGSFYKPRVLRRYLKGLRATGRALGAVRDLDVFMEKIAHYQEALREDQRGGMEPLLEVWQERREKARDRMILFLDSDEFAEFAEDFGDFLTTPGAGVQDDEALVCHVVPRLVYERVEAVRRYETILNTAAIETLHALRIDFKRLRYTLEFFEEVLGQEAREVINEVKTMQDHLGDLNDADVAGRILQEFVADYEKRQAGVQVSERRSIERVIQYMADRAAEKHRLMVTFPEAWARFNRPEIRRALASAVAVL